MLCLQFTYRSIGLRGDGKLIYNSKTEKDLTSEINAITGTASSSFYHQNKEVIGVGFIHKTQELFFTIRNKEIYSMKLPVAMRNKRLHPSISTGSRDDKINVNIG